MEKNSPAQAPLKKPPWIRVRAPHGGCVDFLRQLKEQNRLHTVCESALCPNQAECWESGHATFMIMGSGCTRNCGFCGVGQNPVPVDPDEPRRVARAVSIMGLKHAVITSVTRDDLDDGGASWFAAAIAAISKVCPQTTVEVLIPDFQGDPEALKTVLQARPDILGHNVETVDRLYPRARPQSVMQRSLEILRASKKLRSSMVTKSGLMLGLGETRPEIMETLEKLRAAQVDIVTMGQYLRPGKTNLPVARYYTPDEFKALKKSALSMGFAWVESGPLVRSSYGAQFQAAALCTRKGA